MRTTSLCTEPSQETSLTASFVAKGFPYKDQIEELVILTVFHSAYPNTLTFSTFSIIT